MDPDPHEEWMEYVRLDNERGSHWRMVFEENYVGVGNEKVLLHEKRWDVYMNENKFLIEGGYYVEV